MRNGRRNGNLDVAAQAKEHDQQVTIHCLRSSRINHVPMITFGIMRKCTWARLTDGVSTKSGAGGITKDR